MSEPKRYTWNDIQRVGNIDEDLIYADDPALLGMKRKAEAWDVLIKYELGLLCEKSDGCGKCNEHRAILMSENLLEAIEQAGKSQ